MEQKPRFKIVYTEEAIDFLRHLPQKVKAKVVYNIGKSMYVLDNSLFKKLENTDIWEFVRCIMEMPTGFCILGYRRRHFGYSHPRDDKEVTKNPTKRD